MYTEMRHHDWTDIPNCLCQSGPAIFNRSRDGILRVRIGENWWMAGTLQGWHLAEARGWEDSRLRAARLVEVAGRLRLSTGLRLTGGLSHPARAARPGSWSLGQHEQRNEIMEHGSWSRSVVSSALARLTWLLDVEFQLEGCFLWQEGHIWHVLLLGQRIPVAVGFNPSAVTGHPCGSRYGGHASVDLPASWQPGDLQVRHQLVTAIASAVAEVALASGLGLRMFRWSRAVRNLARSRTPFWSDESR